MSGSVENPLLFSTFPGLRATDLSFLFYTVYTIKLKDVAGLLLVVDMRPLCINRYIAICVCHGMTAQIKTPHKAPETGDGKGTAKNMTEKRNNKYQFR